MVDMNFYNDFAKAAEEAEKFSERVNFGKLTFGETRYVHFKQDENGDFEETLVVTAEQYRMLPTGQRQMEIRFEVDVQEFNPNLDWTFWVNVPIRGGKSDWSKVVLPSLQKALGKAKTQDLGGLLKYLDGKYVQVRSVPQLNSPDFNTLEFVKVYSSRDDCFADWNARFGEGRAQTSGVSAPSAPSAPASNVPDPYDSDSWATVLPKIKTGIANGIPNVKLAEDYMLTPKVIEDVKNGVYG